MSVPCPIIGLLDCMHAAQRLAGEQRIERGHHEQREQGAEGHAAHNHHADLHPALGPRTGGQRQRHRTQHHRPGGHEDGPQSQRSGFDDRLAQLLAFGTDLVSKLHDQNAVLGDQTHQRNQPNLAVDIQRTARLDQQP